MQEAHFTVSLCDYPELPEDKRQQAEARYARVLARQLGGKVTARNDHGAVFSLSFPVSGRT